MRKGVVCRATPIFRNRFTPLAVWQFVESRRSRLVAGTDKETPKFAVFFNPFPLRDFPYLTPFAGAEKVTLRLILCLYRGNVHSKWYSLSVLATSHKRCGSTPCNRGSTILTPSPRGTSPISLCSQGQKRLLYG